MSNALRIGNRSISYEQAKEMLFPELIPQKGNEAMLSWQSCSAWICIRRAA